MGQMMQISVITSMNQDYYDRIGRDCLTSYLANWSTPITVYAESVNIVADPRINTIPFDELGADYQSFHDDHSQSRRCRTFAKKAFSVIHAMHHATGDWLVWLDADVITQRSDPVDVLQTVLRHEYLAMYMGVRYHDHEGTDRVGDWLVPETGFFAVNLRHELLPRFRHEYQRRYRERDFADLRRSYDNDVLGAVIKTVPARYLDLSAGFSKPYKTPLKHTVFGDYLHHFKAKHSKQSYVEDNQ